MNINIPRCATWPPYTWDTTNPDRMAEAEAWVRSLIEDEPASSAASVLCDAPELLTATKGYLAPDHQTTPERGSTGHTAPSPGVSVAWGADRAEVTWPRPEGEPAPNAVCPTCPILAEAEPLEVLLARIDEICDAKRKENAR